MAGREVREYTNLSDPKDKKFGKGKDKIDDEDITFQRMVAKNDVSDVNQSKQEAAPVRKDSSPTSLEDLIAEATTYSDDENESLDAKAQKALECPCVAELRIGPCGTQFSEAFVCFIKSTAEEKGSDCVHPFIALQNCIKANPDAFSKEVFEEDGSKKEEGHTEEYILSKDTEEYKILPPTWAKETK